VDLRASNAKLRERAIRMVQRVTGADRDRAETALELANLQVKLAVVLLENGLDLGEAERRLAAADGRLRTALEAER
jgi:N-acetylmuramic acid 6-phosphate etherase